MYPNRLPLFITFFLRTDSFLRYLIWTTVWLTIETNLERPLLAIEKCLFSSNSGCREAKYFWSLNGKVLRMLKTWVCIGVEGCTLNSKFCDNHCQFQENVYPNFKPISARKEYIRLKLPCIRRHTEMFGQKYAKLRDKMAKFSWSAYLIWCS